MFGSKQDQPIAAPATLPAPPTLEEIHAEASGASAYAKNIFHDAIEELVDANGRFDDVEIRATAEIDRLTQLRADAIEQRRKNVETIANLQALVGE